MSGLAGLWNFDGRPADRALVAALSSPIAHRGGDDRGIWSDGPVGFACQLRRIAPQSSSERQPVADSVGNVLLFDGRLDNRAELLATLADPIAFDAPDSELVLAAWRLWGDGCFAKLQGDFALALFDAGRQTLVLARDPVGCRPLYYWIDGKRIVFASEIKGIVAHPEVRATPNEDLLADHFLLDRLPYEDDGETFFLGIQAVLPGYRLSVTPAGIRAARFWDFDPQAQIRYRSPAEYAEHLRALLIQAVKRRLRSAHPIAVATSGGLDSSIVLCLANDLRRSGGGDAPLVPLSCQTSDDPTTEENRFIRLLERGRGMCVGRLALAPPGDMEHLRRLIWHSESPLFDDGWCALDPLLVAAKASGARILLTGLWSDQLFFSTGYLVDLFWKLAWGRIAQHIDEYARWFVDADASYFRARFRRELLLGLTPAALRSALRPFRTAFANPEGLLPVSRAIAARLRRRRPRVHHPAYRTAHARNIYQAVRAKSHRLQFEADEKMAASHGLEHVTPFLDRDVIAYLMSIPGDIQTRDGVPRALLRDAMQGIVPEPILRRCWRHDAALERTRQHAYLATKTPLSACAALGFVPDARPVDAGSLPFIGLEFWSRIFFSDTLASQQTKQTKGPCNAGTRPNEAQWQEAAVLPSHAHHPR